MTLDKLRELDAAASPGSWRSRPAGDRPQVLSAGGVSVAWMLSKQAEPDAQLAALSHMILPLAEALEPALMRISVLQTNSGTDFEILNEGWAVLAKLKEELNA